MATGAISDAQFAFLSNTEGGASRSLHTGLPPGPSGYMVSRLGRESVSPAPVSASAVGQYHDVHTVNAEPTDYQGSWLDQGHIYQDVSEHINAPWPRVAEVASRRNQIAAYDLSSGESHYPNRLLPGVSADPAWARGPQGEPSNYERDASAVPELGREQGGGRQGPLALEEVMRQIAANRRERGQR